ncbi:hypothetical protein [Ruminococcus sp. FC2018]|uniref:hypothetical protein n=1 Tax=Ruminococcus sp. FC2018 TaxID=1410617 RepID=UPI0012DBF3AC|nr:hypothetical protein [Ruminococcus sp. FC2018]
MKNTKAKVPHNAIEKRPGLWAVLFVLIWAGIFNLLYMLADYIIPYGLTVLLGFMLVYPVCTFVLCFKFAKHNGITPVMPFGIIPIIAAEYVLIPSVRAIVPNVLVVTGFCILFGSGMGNIFADRELLEMRKKQKRDKKLHEDKKYKKILDD